MLRRGITTAPADTEDGDGGADDALALTAQLSDLLDEPARAPTLTLLVKDLLWISRADAQVAEVERERVTAIAGLVFPDNADEIVRETEKLLDAEEEFAKGKITVSQLERRTKDIAAAAAGLGAPLVAINSLAGAGMGAAGLTHALATLGFGGLLGFSSMVTGIGTVVVMGVVVYQGTRFFLGWNERQRRLRYEALLQQIIRNHQLAIADLTDDIAELALRMGEYFELANRNEERLATLKADLSSFQLALADLRAREAEAQAQKSRK